MNTELKLKEYEMLRDEILQYLEEYQNLRNMMYIIAVTILGFGLANDNAVEYVYLLPLVVIIPSFGIYADYFNGIVRDAMYLLVFYESDNSFPINWETQLRKFSPKLRSKDWQILPYIVCAYTSLILYFIAMEKSILNYIIGIGVGFMCTVVFLKVKRIKYEDAKIEWERIKNGGN